MTFAFLGVGLLISTLVHSSAVANDSYSSYYESDEFDHFRRLDEGPHGYATVVLSTGGGGASPPDAVLRSLVAWGFGSGRFVYTSEDVDWTLRGSDLILDLPVPTAKGRTFAEVEEWFCRNNAAGNTRETFASLVEGVLPAPVVVTAVCHSDSAAQGCPQGDSRDCGAPAPPPSATTRTPPPPPSPTSGGSGGSGERWLTVPVALALGVLIIVVFALAGFCIARTWPRRGRGAGEDGESYWFSAAPPGPLVAGVPHLSATVVPGSPGARRVLRLAPSYY